MDAVTPGNLREFIGWSAVLITLVYLALRTRQSVLSGRLTALTEIGYLSASNYWCFTALLSRCKLKDLLECRPVSGTERLGNQPRFKTNPLAFL